MVGGFLTFDPAADWVVNRCVPKFFVILRNIYKMALSADQLDSLETYLIKPLFSIFEIEWFKKRGWIITFMNDSIGGYRKIFKFIAN